MCCPEPPLHCQRSEAERVGNTDQACVAILSMAAWLWCVTDLSNRVCAHGAGVLPEDLQGIHLLCRLGDKSSSCEQNWHLACMPASFPFAFFPAANCKY